MSDEEQDVLDLEFELHVIDVTSMCEFNPPDPRSHWVVFEVWACNPKTSKTFCCSGAPSFYHHFMRHIVLHKNDLLLDGGASLTEVTRDLMDELRFDLDAHMELGNYFGRGPIGFFQVSGRAEDRMSLYDKLHNVEEVYELANEIEDNLLLRQAWLDKQAKLNAPTQPELPKLS